LGIRLFFPTIPKPLKQYTLFKKKYPFRWDISVDDKNNPTPEIIEVSIINLQLKRGEK
jgi:hypothetical protein